MQHLYKIKLDFKMTQCYTNYRTNKGENMKYNKRQDIYKASNVTFDQNTCEAFSYNWWQFVANINGKVVFNNYNYSPTTIKHQYKVRDLLEKLGIKIDLEIECPAGFQSRDFEISIDQHYTEKIKELKRQIDKPRSQAKKNMERRKDIKKLAQLVVQFKILSEQKAA